MTKTEKKHPPDAQLVERWMTDAKSFAQREPAKAVAAALGAGLVIHALPTRFLVASVTAVTVMLLRPALLTLGVIKAMELCSQPARNQNTAS